MTNSEKCGSLTCLKETKKKNSGQPVSGHRIEPGTVGETEENHE